MTDRRGFIVGLAKKMGLGAVWLALPRVATAKATPKRPTNFVIMLADDLGFGDLGCYQHPFAVTPNIDALARDGLQLGACYSAGVNCSPSRAGILTGRHPYRTGIYDWIPAGTDAYLPKQEIAIASWLKPFGYKTCLVGKWHLSGKIRSDLQTNPGDHGFDHWMATVNSARPPINPKNFYRNGKQAGRLRGTAAHVCVQEALDWLAAHKRSDTPDAPVCLFVWFHEAHHPWKTTDRHRALYSGRSAAEKAYYGCVSQMDEAVGELMAGLQKLGMADDTFAMFTSDNGPSGAPRSSGSHGNFRGSKGETHEGGIRIPGLIRWPGRIQPRSESEALIIGTDLFPTMCEIVGAPLPTDRVIDGRSFLPVIEGKRVTSARTYLWHHPAHHFAIRDGDWKLLADAGYRPLELYDIRADPFEKNNRVSAETERVGVLVEKLRSLRTEIQAEGRKWKAWPKRGPFKAERFVRPS